MEFLTDLMTNFLNVVKSISINDIIDMLLLWYLLYKGIKLIRETRAEQLLKGILLICIAYFVVIQLELKTMGFLLETFFKFGILAIIIMFQPELRRALEKMGRTKVSSFNVFSLNNNDGIPLKAIWEIAIKEIVDASLALSAKSTGALIVIERQTKLGEQIDTGTLLNATPSSELLGNIFYPNTPLHDGAVIIRDGMVLAAGCFLPKPQKEEFINKQLGSRHRAGIGMSELSDAIIIIVSEETGTISIAEDGQLTRGFTKENLTKLLSMKLLSENQIEGKKPNTVKQLIEKVSNKWKK